MTVQRYLSRRSCALGVLAIFVLVACDAQESANAPECPKIVIVKETAEMTAFRPGPGRDLTDIVLDARIDRYGGSCDTDLEDDRSGQVDVDLQVFFQATRGPANDDRKGKFTYYIAIADPNENILAKKVFETNFEFEGNRRRIGAVDELTQEIPLRPGERGEDYKIYVGFQLNSEQLDYNRAKRIR